MNYQQLIKQVSEHVLAYYKTHGDPRLVYHDKKHTESVVARATEIANHYQVNDRDYFVVVAASWFHDTGYMVDVNNHEEKSAELALAFLKKAGLPEEDMADVKGCIMATRMPQSPLSLLEKIICDADLYNLGTDDFFDTDKKMRKETATLHGVEVKKPEWWRKSIAFLSAHQYHTDYCQVLLNNTKRKNIEELKRKLAKVQEKDSNDQAVARIALVPVVTDHKAVKKNKDKDNEKMEEPKKGIETMFRITSSNHQRLSDMADNKAHIMITVNSIILSAIISLVLRRLSENEFLVIPTFILLSISLLAITFSILATRPSIPAGVFTREDVDKKTVNLLFFGNFYKATLEEYTYGMEKMMDDKDFLYGSLIRDVYAQGVVLGKKYRLLRIAYNIFMFGLIVSVLAFIVSSAFFAGKPIL
ncbi:Pycsar system effector family protein [Mucilaginibacter psychrotolerans]|uniref:Phosphohydrolase n=1 Tax=Mucilaginibacter psychrotolerans TaxID=1524096 RepID=A0A4Y8SJA7_9SPHI|nr:Pycsar system effector family protein [Mucilaginibacter psychrotolerans]TFF39163.1 phosphohydrolase [Mucilaginibacter psychrotolerans]